MTTVAAVVVDMTIATMMDGPLLLDKLLGVIH